MFRSTLVFASIPLCAALAQEPSAIARAAPPGVVPSVPPAVVRAVPPAVLRAVPEELLVPVAAAESLRVTAAGTGPTVVLLPGLFGSAFGYRHLLALLPAAGYRAVVIEPLGIGGSPRPRGADYSLTAQAERIAAALDRLGDEPAVVVGHSLGVSLALRLAAHHPDRVRAVIALDGGPAEAAATPGFRRAMRYAPWIKWLGGVKRIRPKMRKDLLAASGDSAWVTDEVMDGYTAAAAADIDGTLLAFLAMAESRERDRLAPRLADVRCPVRLVLGTAPHEGGVDAKQVRLMAERLPDFAVDSIAGAGQYLFEEQPKAVAELIRRVMEERATAIGRR
jgi:pimeloyl-ACP methyl ester carboxylesterase